MKKREMELKISLMEEPIVYLRDKTEYLEKCINRGGAQSIEQKVEEK